MKFESSRLAFDENRGAGGGGAHPSFATFNQADEIRFHAPGDGGGVGGGGEKKVGAEMKW